MRLNSVQEYLSALQAVDWLANVGKPVDPPTIVMASWTEAEREIASRDAENGLIDSANAISDDVWRSSSSLMEQWNPLVDDIKPQVINLVDLKLSPDAAGRRLRRATQSHIQWIVLHAAIEVFYDSAISANWNRSMVDWLKQGHLPVGWNGGRYPSGHALVF
ncbi:MAG: hypothetical protein QM754_14160 [Tepidisphaeraceae bacterium]